MTSRCAHTCLLVCLFACVALAFIPDARAALAKPVEWAAVSLASRPIGPGGRFQVKLTAKISPGWHIYAMQVPDNGPLPTEIGIAAGDPLELLTVDEPQVLMVQDPVLHQAVGMFQGIASFTLHLRSPAKLAPRTTIHVLIRFQVCNEQLCLSPRTESVPLTLY